VTHVFGFCYVFVQAHGFNLSQRSRCQESLGSAIFIFMALYTDLQTVTSRPENILRKVRRIQAVRD
jgi:hypothetical protein